MSLSLNSDQICLPTKQYRGFIGMTDWCQSNCLRYPPNCPSSLCYCPSSCEGKFEKYK